MTARSDTWMPLYIGDYLADTMHLNGAEHGAYILLIMHYWRSGPLPDDDKALAAIARTERTMWDSEIGPVVREFFHREGGRLRHRRIDREMANANAMTEQRRAAGIASAEARAKRREVNGGGNDDGNGLSNESANGSGTAINECSTSAAAPSEQNGRPSPSPSPSQKQVSLPSEARPPDADAGDARAEIEQAFVAWNALASQCGLPRAQRLDDGRRKCLAARLRENGGIAGWLGALEAIRGSPFLLGQEHSRNGERSWNASLDWLLKPSNFRKVAEGNYTAKAPAMSRSEEAARAIYEALVPNGTPPPHACDPDAITLQPSEWISHEP